MQSVVFLALALLPISAMGQDANQGAGAATAAPQQSGDNPQPPSPAPDANASTKPVDFQSLPSVFFRDEYRIWTAPFRPGNYDSHSMKKYGIPFLLIVAAAIATDVKTSQWLPNTRDQEIWSGRVSQIGAPYTLAGFAGITYLIARTRANSHLKETSLLALEALGHSQLVAFGVKEITQRERPFVDKRRLGFWQGGDSFPSGHAAGSFAVAAAFAYEYRDQIAVPIAAYSAATLVSLSRMSARRHWVSDIFAGGSMGFMLGRYVYKSHHDPSLPGSPVDRKAERREMLIPEIGMRDGGVALAWKW